MRLRADVCASASFFPMLLFLSIFSIEIRDLAETI